MSLSLDSPGAGGGGALGLSAVAPVTRVTGRGGPWALGWGAECGQGCCLTDQAETPASVPEGSGGCDLMGRDEALARQRPACSRTRGGM